MLAVNGVGKPCAGEPHARFDGRELETEPRPVRVMQKNDRMGNLSVHMASSPTTAQRSPRQLSTLHVSAADAGL